MRCPRGALGSRCGPGAALGATRLRDEPDIIEMEIRRRTMSKGGSSTVNETDDGTHTHMEREPFEVQIAFVYEQ
jgi:hypothetical protein